MGTSSRVGVYVDAANLYRNGGTRMRYDVLREFACRDGSEPLRLNAYVTHDVERAETDAGYRRKAVGFHSALRDFGYKVIIKPVKWFDDGGHRYAKANSDLDMAVDALLQSENLDRVLLATGDGDFVQVVRALQNKGCRVEIVAFDHVSRALREEADIFFSGHLIPNLSPSDGRWGDLDARVRGWCYYFDDERGIGFMRYLLDIDSGLWLTDTRNPDSPYETAFFHYSELADTSLQSRLPSRDLVFEFTLAPSDVEADNVKAIDIELVSDL